MRHYHLQLTNAATDEAITSSGGVCYVAVKGGPRKVPVFTKDATGNYIAASNPVALVNGAIDFYTLDPVVSVDLYGQAPGGFPFTKKNVSASGDASLPIGRPNFALLTIPFSIVDTVANTDTGTGFTVPANSMVLPNPVVDVTTLEAARTLQVGTLVSAGGTVNGFVNALSLAAAGTVKASLAFGAVTLGSRLQVSAGTGSTLPVPEGDVGHAGRQISYTLSASTVSAEGFIRLPVQISALGM